MAFVNTVLVTSMNEPM